MKFLRHTLATLAYRAGKSLQGAPAAMADARLCEGGMSGKELVDHLGDVLQWACGLVHDDPSWKPESADSWDASVERFWTSLARLDAVLENAPADCPAERLFQGPVADSLTHVGQLATLRRIAGDPIRPENYFKADINAGHVGPDQPFHT